MTRIARQLKRWRVGKGLSQKAAAKRIGCSQPTVCWVELGKRPIGPELAKKFARAGVK